jgi:hypothetical protein
MLCRPSLTCMPQYANMSATKCIIGVATVYTTVCTILQVYQATMVGDCGIPSIYIYTVRSHAHWQQQQHHVPV